jgi:hypothetical protein
MIMMRLSSVVYVQYHGDSANNERTVHRDGRKKVIFLSPKLIINIKFMSPQYFCFIRLPRKSRQSSACFFYAFKIMGAP